MSIEESDLRNIEQQGEEARVNQYLMDSGAVAGGADGDAGAGVVDCDADAGGADSDGGVNRY